MKFQYIRKYKHDDYDNTYCISIVSSINHEKTTTSNVVLNWSASFKNPNDHFNKVVARNILLDKNNTTKFHDVELVLPRSKFKAYEIRSRILDYLHYNETALLPHYRNFVDSCRYDLM